MPCAQQHVFHKECLLKWLDSRNTCPICRHGLPVSEASMEEAPRISPAEQPAEQVESPTDES